MDYEESGDEEVPFHRGADCVRAQASQAWDGSRGICRKLGIAEATCYVWRKKDGGLGPSELKRLRLLEEENRKLKQLVADLSPDKAMLQEVVAKKR
ncbi:transposase [Xanthomonas oryzae]|uniref:Transposase n=1 Tax=Xanthomonas oryzae pv. leersiae TaxID=3112258 RepID=A0AAJ6GWL7_9XANT|nr:transposase [Xanthomonas oryzae]QBG87782.1 hypothetical protein EYC54_08515 [Xanthomonas oryzae]QBH00431.1 hypothetical protein EYC56_15525 [Xanthomonas oryzae]WIX05500.1 transposase [Xanthomonas oryzae pv. oryzae]